MIAPNYLLSFATKGLHDIFLPVQPGELLAWLHRHHPLSWDEGMALARCRSLQALQIAISQLLGRSISHELQKGVAIGLTKKLLDI